jgi:hypothetical protein
MSRIEDLVRGSLRQRAEDVEPTPALWREVDRRIARRRRLHVTSWSVSLVAAALAAFLVVPGLLAGGDRNGPEIEPMGPAVGVVPSIAAVVGDGGLALLDLTTGERTTLDATVDGPVHQLVVRPGSTAEHFDLAVVHGPEGAGATTTWVYMRPEGGLAITADESDIDGFLPTIRWSPTGSHLAYTVAGEDGRVRLFVQPAPTGPELVEKGREQEDAANTLDEPGRVPSSTWIGTLGVGDLLLDWVLTGQRGSSELWVRRADDTVGVLPLQAEGSSFVAGGDGGSLVADAWGGGTEASMVREVVAAVSSDPAAGTGGPPLYLLAPGTQDGVSLYWSGPVAASGESPVVEVPLDPPVGDADLADLWLDAEQDAVLVGDGQRTWLFSHDGDGDRLAPVQLPEDITAGALFDAGRAAADEDTAQIEPEPSPDDPEPSSDAQESSSDDPGPSLDDREPGIDEPEPGADGDAVTRAPFTEPLLTVAGSRLRLLRVDGSEQTYELNLEGEAHVAGLAVRPGSTPDDLTVLVLTVADGIWDLWDVRILDEQLTRDPVPGEFLSGMNAAAGEGVGVRGPVWAPDGSAFAWTGSGSRANQLHIVGWDEGPGTGRTADDNAAFELPRELEGAVLHGWRSVPSSPDGPERFRMDFTQVDRPEGAFSLVIERQGDGAWAIPSPGAGPLIEHGWSNVAAFGGGSQEDIGWAIRLTGDGLVLAEGPDGTDSVTPLPDDLLGGEAWPHLWFAEFEDGAIVVGSREVGTSHVVTADREVAPVAGAATGAAVIR